jgi:putative heme-binding domain-containing protein
METRLLVRHAEGGVYGVSYQWNESATDAVLLEGAHTALRPGCNPTLNDDATLWHFPDRQSCLSCHNPSAGFILGVNAEQLNQQLHPPFPRRPANQLVAWSRINMFSRQVRASDLGDVGLLVSPWDERQSLEARARSYLAANCSACHRDGGAQGHFRADLAHTATLGQSPLPPKQGDFGLDAAKIVAAGDPFRSVLYYRMAKLGPGRMPLVGAHALDVDGLRLLRCWIEQLDRPAGEAQVPGLDDKQVRQNELIEQLISDNCASPESVTSELLNDTRGAFALWQRLHDGVVAAPTRQYIVTAATQSDREAIRDLYQWYLAPEHRTQRLGTDFDPAQVLRLIGDAERGRTLFQQRDTLTCRSCHDVRPNQRNVGPSLFAIGKKYDRAQLLHHVCHPSDRVEAEFATWSALTVNGLQFTGLLAHRSDHGITLVDANGRRHELTAADVESLERQAQSLMTAQLLQSLTAQEAADLLAYLSSLE